MGTNNLTMVSVGGEIKVAQYGQWDGNPTGQGARVQTFVQKVIENPEELLVQFTQNCLRVRPTRDGELTALHEASGLSVPEFLDQNPQWNRDLGARILDWLLDQQEGDSEIVLKLDPEFLDDHVYCEWAYGLDLDNLEITVHWGCDSRHRSKFSFFDYAALDLETFQSWAKGLVD